MVKKFKLIQMTLQQYIPRHRITVCSFCKKVNSKFRTLLRIFRVRQIGAIINSMSPFERVRQLSDLFAY